MKKLIIIPLILSAQLTYAALDPNSDCDLRLKEHLSLVNETNNQFAKLANIKNVELSSYQVTKFEHLMTERFNSLKALQQTNCELKAVKELVIQSDMIDLSKYAISDFKLRRIIAVLNKYKKDIFKDLKSIYYKSTMTETIQENLELLKKENNESALSEINLNLSLENISPMTSISDASVKVLSGAVGALARVWGKLSDKTIWREGHLKNNAEALKIMESKLMPLDLLFETRNYTLTSFTIPGHFGHVAIYMGTKEQLIELGLWDQDFMKIFREQIEQGNSIIEVRKEGIKFVKLANFINLDETAGTRINGLIENAESVFKLLLEQFGKKYDFTFDAHTSHKITCAELISFSYGDINWPMKASASIVNLRPDDLALYTANNLDKSQFLFFLVGNEDFKTFQNKSEEEFRQLFK